MLPIFRPAEDVKDGYRLQVLKPLGQKQQDFGNALVSHHGEEEVSLWSSPRSSRLSVCFARSIRQVPQVNRVFLAVGSAAGGGSGAHFPDDDSKTPSLPGCARSSKSSRIFIEPTVMASAATSFSSSSFAPACLATARQ